MEASMARLLYVSSLFHILASLSCRLYQHKGVDEINASIRTIRFGSFFPHSCAVLPKSDKHILIYGSNWALPYLMLLWLASFAIRWYNNYIMSYYA